MIPVGMARFAVVLGGGGARGFAHIGVLLELRRAGLEPDLVLGTSMGAIVGALYAVGQDLERVAELLSVLDLNRLFGLSASYSRVLERVLVRSFLGHFRGRYPSEEDARLLSQFREFLWLLCKGKRFRELEVPLAVVAADLVTGEEVVIDEGPVHEAVLASAALPGVLPPVSRDGRLLVDGGAVNNLPVDIAARMGARTVLGVAVGSRGRTEFHTPADVILQAHYLTAKELVAAKIALARERLGERLLIVHPPVADIGALEFSRLPEAIAAGREAVRPVVDVLAGLLERGAYRSARSL